MVVSVYADLMAQRADLFGNSGKFLHLSSDHEEGCLDVYRLQILRQFERVRSRLGVGIVRFGRSVVKRQTDCPVRKTWHAGGGERIFEEHGSTFPLIVTRYQPPFQPAALRRAYHGEAKSQSIARLFGAARSRAWTDKACPATIRASV